MAEATAGGRCLVLASGNPGKLRELTAMLEPLGWAVRPQSEWNVGEAVEDGLSFIENALIKARHAARFTGLHALADDSGLVVDALDGAPGIYSARYAGPDASDEDNNRKLLDALSNVPDSLRTAHFYCAMAMVRNADDPAPLVAVGKWDGVIMAAPAGQGGFGYDPLFYVPAESCSSAQLSPEVKNRLSHRGQALSAMAEQIESYFGE